MTDATSVRPARTVRSALLVELPLDLALVALWMLLWGSVTPLTIVTGVVVALVVTRGFVLPPLPLADRLNPFYLVAFVVRFALDVVVASVQVAALAFRPGQRRSSIIAVHMRSHSDLTLGLTAIAVSLVPGSFVIELNADERELLVHALHTESDRDVERVRATVRRTEDRMIRAIGSRDDLERIVS